MSNAYHQLFIQLVFAVQFRKSLIHRDWKEELFKYITGIVQMNNHKMLQINGMPDHIHILIGYNPNQLIPKLVEQIKTSSGSFIRTKGFVKNGFNWQTGYGAFSYHLSDLQRVATYIENQEQHHLQKTFEQEYEEFLKAFKIEYQNKYLFEYTDIHSWDP